MYRGLTFLLAAAVAAAPAHAADDSPICPDRPSKGTGTCTVPAGHWQIESGLIDWTHDTNDGVRSDLTVIAASLVKFGIADDADLEIGVVPWEISRVRGPGGRERGSGFGDMLVRGKVRLTGGTARLQVALDPFVKVPTAKHDLGNGKVEGGVTVPAGMSLGWVVTLPSCESAMNNSSSSPFELQSMNTEKLLFCSDVSTPDGESDAMSTAWPPWAIWLCITRACGSVFGWPDASG